LKKEKYNVTGMTCSACSSRVEKCVSKIDGVKTVSVNLLTNSMQVEYEEEQITPAIIVSEVEKAGYGAEPVMVGKQNQAKSAEEKRGETAIQLEMKDKKHRLVWSFVFLIPMMYLSMGEMLHHMLGLPVPGFIQAIFYGDKNILIFSFTQFLLVLPIIYLNQKYYQVGFRNLFHTSPNMDTLIAVGSSAAVLYGIVAIFQIGYGFGHQDAERVSRYGSQLYFESAAMIVTLITLGKYLESRSKGKTSEAVEKLMDLAPRQATVVRDGKEVLIPADELVVGDVVIVKPGESIAADGVIVEGTASMDEAMITGESMPVEKQAGDTVIAGTINKNGYIHFQAKKVGEDSTISQLIRLVDEASASKAPIAKLADKIAGIFVPVVMVIAFAAFVIWLLAGASFEFALSIGIAVLVISCPCALGLATPVAIMVGTGEGAKNGILIKSGEALETAHRIDTVVMDKTGTITKGRPVVTDVLPLGVSLEELVAIAAGIEKGSEHPLAEAVLVYADENKIQPLQMQGFSAVFGKGIQATADGHSYYAGNPLFLQECGIEMLGQKEQLERLADEGKTPLLFAKDDHLLGMIAVADEEKESSRQAIALFAQMGIEVVMLTGDNSRTAEAIRKRLSIPKAIAEVLPQDKKDHIEALQAAGHKVAMIGDGINDAPALAQADVGIAIGAGTDIAIESADAVLMRNDLLDAVSAIRLSKAVIRNIKENLFWAFFYNCIGIPLAAGVLYPGYGITLSPMIGAAAMSLSSVCVVFNALRLRFFKPLHAEETIHKTNLKEEIKMTTELQIEGMMCEHCKKHVEDALKGMAGVSTVEVSLENNNAIVTTETEISTDEFDKVIADAGYKLLKK
jgi:Cu+-exporting ATPase